MQKTQILEQLKDLTPTSQRLLDRLITGKLLWMPSPQNKPQMDGYCTEANILYFGGRAGGGKSDLLLGLSINEHQKSLIFRREYKQLRELIDRSHEILDPVGAKYSQTLSRWSGIPGNKVLEFGAVQYESDIQNYKGRPHDFLGFDEVPDFTETQVKFLMAWNRTTDPGQRCRIVCTGNPPSTPEGRWVVKYWAPWLRRDYSKPAKNGELRWFAMLDGTDSEVTDGIPFTHKGERIEPKSRTFIPASLKDNPYLSRTDYYATLQSLPEPLRSQLLYGDFFLEEETQTNQVIPSEWVRAAQARWREDDVRASMSYTAVGLDPSRGGKDQTVLAPRTGTYFHPLMVFEGSQVRTGQECVSLVTEALGLNFAGTILIDVIAIGSSVFDLMTDLEYDVIDVNFAQKSFMTDKSGKLQMRNVRAEAYWLMREALEPLLGDDLALPPDEELFEDLTTPTWERTTTGILIESKARVKKRLQRSPGKGDALVMSYLDAAPGVLFR